ncbi:hypothetical protein [Labrys wisconsinensis]|uniref:Uncharacterized protein n=1 Tax=Labrys wisconsinensis TaxID=425677 RepID=A0ABU0J8S8_9HYPH|nr:hypothetical protein [Labrys wisconsinensis]MDQ0470681.1 hypothetical protein [Labrys wisconsinensis]
MIDSASLDAIAEDADEVGEAMAQLHRAYLVSIRQHRDLVGDLHATLLRLEAALDAASIDPGERQALTAGIEKHVDTARAIVSRIDGALVSAAVGPTAGFH